MKQKNATIFDVADYCHVSPATVSRVLSGSKYPVSSETRAKVLDAAKKLDYLPNMLGRGLKTSRNNDIGVVIPNMSSYYSLLLQAIQDVAYEHDSQIILSSSCRDLKIESHNVDLLLQKQVKGILIATIDENEDILRRLLNAKISVVAMEQGVKADCSRTYFNFVGGSIMAMEHLIGCGHKKIGFVSSPLTRSSRKDVMRGYKACLHDHGIPLDDQYLFIFPSESSANNEAFYDYEIGKKSVKHFLNLTNPPTAIFCINDMIAFGVINEMQANGITVPDQVSVIGFDNIPFTEMFSPTLTTIDQSTYDLGRISAELLFSNMAIDCSKQPSRVSMRLEPKLLIRESTKATQQWQLR